MYWRGQRQENWQQSQLPSFSTTNASLSRVSSMCRVESSHCIRYISHAVASEHSADKSTPTDIASHPWNIVANNMHTIIIGVWSAFLLQPSQLTNPHYLKRPSKTNRLRPCLDVPNKSPPRRTLTQLRLSLFTNRFSTPPWFINQQSAGKTNSRFG